MRNELVFAGTNLIEFGVRQVDSIDAWNKPLRKVTKVTVPGRNGDLLIDEGAFNNVPVPYKLIIPENFRQNYLNLSAWLSSFGGYERLEFSGDPNVYRIARVQSDFSPMASAFIRMGTVVVSFDCKPQRWLKTGENWVPVTSGIFNPTHQKAKPVIRIFGTGTIMIGSKTITVNTAGTEYIDFDCETLDASEGAYNRNSNIEIDFQDLSLNPGNNGITLNGVTAQIKPRWWET